MISRARVQVEPDWKPPRPEPRPPKPLKKTRGFRTSPKYLSEQFRFAVLHEFGGRCIMLGTVLGASASTHSLSVSNTVEQPVTGQGERAAEPGRPTTTFAPHISTDVEVRQAHVCDGPLDPAHLIPKATLRKLGFPETVVQDHRNGVAACRRAHRRHDDGLERFSRELLPPSVFDFARDHGLEYLLDRLYPKKELA